MGSRGDSFYEYLLKDLIFSQNELAGRLWRAFRLKLPGLFAESAQVARPQGPRWPHRAAAEPPRGRAAQAGGWFEAAQDAERPWLFVKEVTPQHTVPKMDHLPLRSRKKRRWEPRICFLPGAIALEVFHQQGQKEELHLAHRLAQSCVHMRRG